MDQYKQKAINFFLKNLPEYSINDLIEIEEIHFGFTNQSFRLKMHDNNRFQVRLGQNNDIVNRRNEKMVLECIDDKNYIYYDEANGDSIKKWISGKHISEKEIDEEFLIKLLDKINQFHNYNIAGFDIIRHDYFCFLNPGFIPTVHLNMYKKLVNEIDQNNWILSHNDLNLMNILVDKNKDIIFLDFEWSRINHPLWDISNFIRESDLSIDLIKFIANRLEIDLKTIMEFVYICTNFAYQWTFSTKYDEKISKYRKNTLILMDKYLEILNSMK